MGRDTKKKEKEKRKPCSPPPPRLPRDFKWSGRYQVPDLDVNVPFTWHGNGGNTQMITGGPEYPIWFTNVIFDGYLYTLTHKWPGLTGEQKCIRIGKFTLEDLNALFARAHFVGPEILEQKKKDRRVNHFRVSVALPVLPPGNHFRVPITEIDIYLDRDDPNIFRKVLHFGFQNLLDPNLDEWFTVDRIEEGPGEVVLPCECHAPGPCSATPVIDGVVKFLAWLLRR